MHSLVAVDFYSPLFWVAVGQIVIIDLLLSGDNAMVIALACRRLPDNQRKMGIFWGVGGAIFLRVVLTFFAVSLLALPYLKIIGGALLLWIGIKLLSEDKDGASKTIDASANLAVAIKTIILADVVMSLDNVVAVAAAARGSLFLLFFGLALSIPLMIWSSQLFLRLIDRFPLIIYIGGGLLGWIALSMAITDPILFQLSVDFDVKGLHILLPSLGAIFVIVTGLILSKNKTKEPSG